MRELTREEAIGRALGKRFRKPLWQPFVAACKRYGLTRAGDEIAVALDGSSETLCAAALLRELRRHSEVPFTLRVLLAPDAPDIAAELAVMGFEPEPDDGRPLTANVRAGAVTMSEVTETLLASMLCEGGLRAILPRADAGGVTLIQPLYCVERRDIRAWCRYHGLPWRPAPLTPDRERMRALIDSLLPGHPNAEISLFRAAHAVHLDTFPREGV